LAAAGYGVEFKDPLTLTPDEQHALLALAREPETAFAMTLGRLFDLRDVGLLVGVCHDASGTPVAFNQYLPAPTIGGFSLDATGPPGNRPGSPTSSSSRRSPGSPTMATATSASTSCEC
jgi:hypothetical protein